MSAIDKLVDALVALRRVDWPADPDMGATFYTVGLISGGVAPNVIPPDADAEIMFRTVGSHRGDQRHDRTHAGALVAIDDVLVVPPVRLAHRPGHRERGVRVHDGHPAGSIGGARRSCSGPGSITLAHTEDEHVPIAELHRAVELYVQIAKHLLQT